MTPQLSHRGVNVELGSSVRYLGVNIDRGLRMTAHAMSALAAVRYARFFLWPVLASRLPVRTKFGIYKTYVRSSITYAAATWYHLIPQRMRVRLQAQQNLALRAIVGAERYVRNDVIARDLNVESLEEFRIDRNPYKRADDGSHEHLHKIAPLHARPPDGRALSRELLEPPAMAR
ncbi:uncharacterized protein LOC105842439 [Bombyx mori]|uniref:Uncharacterized protein n=1 Tax=Bombyx mori TaxID=7091 RepID=A0A8R2QUP4_BOMMO|nr:uncharacterized protein LOC105842439 [Bombyx mori]